MKPRDFSDNWKEWDTEDDYNHAGGIVQEEARKEWQYQILTKACACIQFLSYIMFDILAER